MTWDGSIIPAHPGFIGTITDDDGSRDVTIVAWKLISDGGRFVEAHPLVVTDSRNAYAEISWTVRDIRPGVVG